MLEGSTGCYQWEAGLFLTEFILSNMSIFKGEASCTLHLDQQICLRYHSAKRVSYWVNLECNLHNTSSLSKVYKCSQNECYKDFKIFPGAQPWCSNSMAKGHLLLLECQERFPKYDVLLNAKFQFACHVCICDSWCSALANGLYWAQFVVRQSVHFANNSKHRAHATFDLWAWSECQGKVLFWE